MKGPPSVLEVRLGTNVLRAKYATDVFCRSLQEIGLNKVEGLKLKLGGRELVSASRPYDDELANYRQVESWWIATHSSTAEKATKLQQVADLLCIPIRVSIDRPLSLEDL